jgi:hypothetical protein
MTSEAKDILAAGTSTSCIKWTSSYTWRNGEQACSNAEDDTMFSCLFPSLCTMFSPYSTTSYTNLAAVNGVGNTTALIGTGDQVTVWKNRELTIAPYDATSPDNCYTTWTAGMNYQKLSTLCDGIIYQCLDPENCGINVPGATGSETTWG